MRFLFYSHDGLGLGHTRRHIAVASALTQLAPNASILLATGADDAGRIGLPDNVEVLKLPGLRKIDNDSYGSRRLRIPSSEIRALRANILTAVVKTYRPAVLLVDKHPFGAKGEFREALQYIRGCGGRTVLGLRDILDDPRTVALEWGPAGVLDLIASHYDQVIVYGERAVFDPVTEYNFPPAVAARTTFAGYVVNRDPTHGTGTKPEALGLETRARPVVLATTGGGEDGSFLLETFMRAATGTAWQGVVVAGPMTPEPQFESLKRLAAEYNVPLHSFLPGLSGMFWNIDALVCMGGYNTLLEAVSTGVPTVCVPRKFPRSEQFLRASAFKQLGLIHAIDPDELNAENLRREIGLALSTSRSELLSRSNSLLSFDGARQTATQLLALASQPQFSARNSTQTLARAS